MVFDLEREQGQERNRRRLLNQPRRRSATSASRSSRSTADLAKSLDLPARTKGLLVSQVKEGSAADAEGIKEGDVITKVVRDRKNPAPGQRQGIPGPGREVDELSFYVQSGKAPGRFVTLSKAKK